MSPEVGLVLLFLICAVMTSLWIRDRIIILSLRDQLREAKRAQAEAEQRAKLEEAEKLGRLMAHHFIEETRRLREEQG